MKSNIKNCYKLMQKSFLIICILLFSVLNQSCSVLIPHYYLKDEAKKNFQYSEFLFQEDIEKLNEIESDREYIERVTFLLRNREAGLYSTPQDDREFIQTVNFINNLDRRIILNFQENKDFTDSIWDLYIELNKNPTIEYALSFINGRYKYVAMLVEKFEQFSSPDKIQKFIKTIPSPKMIVLAQYELRIWDNSKPSAKEAKEIYLSIDDKNYETLLMSSDLFFFDVPSDINEELREKYLESLSYYIQIVEKYTK